MRHAFTVVDLRGVAASVIDGVDWFGPDAKRFVHLEMGLFRARGEVPPDLARALPTQPREVVRDRATILGGIDALLVEAIAHRRAHRPNGNRALAEASGATELVYPWLSDPGPGATEPRHTGMGWMAALNISLGMGEAGAFDPQDPVNVATRRAAAWMPVVMAAGNARGLRRGPAAFSSWAKAPWVISVAALRDGVLAEDSACGAPDDPTFGPTVAAPDDRLTVFDATTGDVGQHRGTSIATPVVSHELAKLAALVLTVRAHAYAAAGETIGVPRVGCGLVDYGIDAERLAMPRWPYGALPLDAVDGDAISQMAATAIAAGVDVRKTPTTATLTHLLVASARPVPGHGRHEVGAGEVSPGTTAVFLAKLTAGGYLRSIGGDTRDVEEAAKSLDYVPLTGNTLPGALSAWSASHFWWLWDFREARQVLGLSLSTDEEIAEWTPPAQ